MSHGMTTPNRVRALFVRAAASLLAAACALIPQGWSAANVVPGSIAESCTISVPVYVVGATPSGVAAAVAAARIGEPVLVTESRPYPGGDLTGPMLNMFDMDYGPNGQLLSQGVFMDIYRRLGLTFDVEYAKKVFREEVRGEPLITTQYNEHPFAMTMDGERINEVMVENTVTHAQEIVCAKRIIDATDDGDIAAMAGVPYTLGRESSGIDRSMMSATLVFELGGVNWRQVVGYVTGLRGHQRTHAAGSYHGNVWGYAALMAGYHPTRPDVAIYDLNLGLQDNGAVLVNGLLLFGVDGTDPASVAKSMRDGREELDPLVEYLREWAPGFDHAYLIKPADYLYIRETRHIRGLYTLKLADLVAGRVFWDAIGVASYPIDLHPYRPGEFSPFAARRYTYTIPLRALVPYGISNMLVASRSISASYEAAGSARIVPTTMEEGQAAGAAAVISILNRVSIPQMAQAPDLVHALQVALNDQGAYLLPETVEAAVGHRPLASASVAPAGSSPADRHEPAPSTLTAPAH
jgi:hypothetical protein